MSTNAATQEPEFVLTLTNSTIIEEIPSTNDAYLSKVDATADPSISLFISPTMPIVTATEDAIFQISATEAAPSESVTISSMNSTQASTNSTFIFNGEDTNSSVEASTNTSNLALAAVTNSTISSSSLSTPTIQATNENVTINSLNTDVIITTNTPCSNDNPNWNEETQPCPNALSLFEIFDEAITTEGTISSSALDPTTTSSTSTGSSTTSSVTTTETIFTTSSNEKTFPSVYSCSEDFNIQSNNNSSNLVDMSKNGTEAVYFRFNYEIYTPPNVTKSQISKTLQEFENALGFGVADAAGLTDCLQQSSSESPISLSESKSISSLVTKRRRHSLDRKGYIRRSLQKLTEKSEQSMRNLGDGMNEHDFVAVSINPIDIIDTTLLSCTSEIEMEISSECTPIHGFMTAWISEQYGTRLRQLQQESETQQTPEEYLLDVIQVYIEKNQTDYLNDKLLQVIYVGQRDLKINQIDPDVLSRQEKEKGPKSMIIGIGVAAALLVIILFGLVNIYQQRQRRNRDLTLSPDSNTNFESEIDTSLNNLNSSSAGAFPTDPMLDSVMASDGGSVKDEDDKFKSSMPPLDDSTVVTENLFGLKGKMKSDEYRDESQNAQLKDPEINPIQSHGLNDSVDMEPVTPTMYWAHSEDSSTASEEQESNDTPEIYEDVAPSSTEATMKASGRRLDDSSFVEEDDEEMSINDDDRQFV